MEIMKNPQALLCLHHFCLECINRLNRIIEDDITGVECPFCRKFTPDNSIQDSFMMNNLIEMYQKQQGQQSDEKECLVESCSSAEKLCMQCDRPDVKYVCSNCQIELCESCKDRHLRIPTCRDHTIITIGDYADSSASNVVNVAKFCGKHPRNLIKYSCVPCNKAICVECKIESHDTHKTESVDDALDKLMKQARAQIDIINDQSKTVQSKLTKIKETQEIIFTKVEEAKQKIYAKTESLISKIEEDSSKLIEEIESHSGAKMKEIGIIEEDLQNKVASHESLLSWGNTMVNMTQGPGLLCELQEGLLQKMESCASELSKLDQSEQYDPKIFNINFTPTECSSNIVGSVSVKQDTVEGKNVTTEILNLLQNIKQQETQHPHSRDRRWRPPPTPKQNVQKQNQRTRPAIPLNVFLGKYRKEHGTHSVAEVFRRERNEDRNEYIQRRRTDILQSKSTEEQGSGGDKRGIRKSRDQPDDRVQVSPRSAANQEAKAREQESPQDTQQDRRGDRMIRDRRRSSNGPKALLKPDESRRTAQENCRQQ